MSKPNPIFAAYVPADRDIVQPIICALESWGIRIWDRELDAGEDWALEIGRFFQNAPFVVAFTSANSLGSRFFLSEVTAAYIQKKLIVVALDKIPADKFPTDLSKIQLIDFSDRSLGAAARALAILERALRPGVVMFSLIANPIIERLNKAWRETLPSKAIVGFSQELTFKLDVDQLRQLIESAGISTHPIFGTSKREPTIRARVVVLSNGVDLQSLDNEAQWVSTYNASPHEKLPLTWHHHLLPTSSGEKRLLSSSASWD